MRVKSETEFAHRPSKPLIEIPKYFLIYEGEVTEPMYFEGLNVNRKKLAINENLSLISVLRSVDEIHNSHPKFVYKMVVDIKNQSEFDNITKENLLKSIKDYAEANHLDKGYVDLAKDYIETYSNDYINTNEITNVIMDIYKNEVFVNVATDVINYLEMQRIALDYNSDIDVINLIVDRDKGNFKDFQYEQLLKQCKESNINLYVSNPCFETWLLMHFDEFDKLDFQKLIENKRINGKKGSRKYVDKMLSDIVGYDKSNLKFDYFVNNVDKAINREKNYCEDLKLLENNVGSNVGLLIEKLRK